MAYITSLGTNVIALTLHFPNSIALISIFLPLPCTPSHTITVGRQSWLGTPRKWSFWCGCGCYGHGIKVRRTKKGKQRNKWEKGLGSIYLVSRNNWIYFVIFFIIASFFKKIPNRVLSQKFWKDFFTYVILSIVPCKKRH